MEVRQASLHVLRRLPRDLTPRNVVIASADRGHDDRTQSPYFHEIDGQNRHCAEFHRDGTPILQHCDICAGTAMNIHVARHFTRFLSCDG